METLNALAARHAAEAAALTRQHAIAAACPVTPKRVQLTRSGSLPVWLTYEADSLVDALNLVDRLGDVVPFHVYKGTFTRYQPEALASDKSGDHDGAAFALELRVNQGPGFGVTGTLKAFVLVAGEIMHAHIAIAPYGRGFPLDAFAARKIVERQPYRKSVTTWQANNTLASMSDSYTKWATGSEQNADFAYLFASDTLEPGEPSHAMSALRNLSEQGRRSWFAANPLLEGFLSTMCEDAQHNVSDSLEDYDVGTIWTVPHATLRRADQICRDFLRRFDDNDDVARLVESNGEKLGSDLYMESAGHGVGFQDRDHYSDDSDDNRRIGEALSAAVVDRIEIDSAPGVVEIVGANVR